MVHWTLSVVSLWASAGRRGRGRRAARAGPDKAAGREAVAGRASGQLALSEAAVEHRLDRTLEATGLRDQAGQPLTCTPYDFRRMFIPEAVTGGLPVQPPPAISDTGR